MTVCKDLLTPFGLSLKYHSSNMLKCWLPVSAFLNVSNKCPQYKVYKAPLWSGPSAWEQTLLSQILSFRSINCWFSWAESSLIEAEGMMLWSWWRVEVYHWRTAAAPRSLPAPDATAGRLQAPCCPAGGAAAGEWCRIRGPPRELQRQTNSEFMKIQNLVKCFRQLELFVTF